jgi:arsenate reductase (glutaredoxin)
MLESMANVTIWHHTGCGSSKNALAYLEAKGIEPDVYLYIKEKPGKAEIAAVLERLNLKPSELLRPDQAQGAELGLYEPGVPEDQILEAMAQHAILIQRPIVITDQGAVIARPKTRIDEVL